MFLLRIENLNDKIDAFTADASTKTTPFCRALSFTTIKVVIKKKAKNEP